MSGYGMGGYVGSSEDARRIRRQQEQREKEKAEYEAAKKKSDANVDSAGLRKFDTGSSEVLPCCDTPSASWHRLRF